MRAEPLDRVAAVENFSEIETFVPSFLLSVRSSSPKYQTFSDEHPSMWKQ